MKERREHIAVAALRGVICGMPLARPPFAAGLAVQYADALMAKLDEKPGSENPSAAQQLLDAWSRVEEESNSLIDQGASAVSISDFSGAAKDLLLQLGLEWNNEKQEYVFTPASSLPRKG